MQVTRSFGMLAVATTGYPKYSLRPAGGSWSTATNTGVTQDGTEPDYWVDLDLASGNYSIRWDGGTGSTFTDDFAIVDGLAEATLDDKFADLAALIPDASAVATATAAAILTTPANKLLTNGSGYVTTSNPAAEGSSVTEATIWAYGTRSLTDKTGFSGTATNLGNVTVGGYATGQDPATLVWAATTRTLSAFGFTVTVGTNNDKTGYTAAVSDKTGFELSSTGRTAVANEVEAQIIDDTDSEKVLKAITDKIASVNPDLGGLSVAAIASASATSVWAAGTRSLTDKTGFALTVTPPTAAQVRTEMDANSTKLAYLTGDAFARIGVNGVGLTAIPYTGPSSSTVATAAATATATAILVTPANKLATDGTGKVTTANPATSGADPSDLGDYLAGVLGTAHGTGSWAVPATVTLADGSITSAKFAAIVPGLSGFLERLALLANRFFPVAGGSVRSPKSGNGNMVIKGTGGTTLATIPTTDDGTNQTLGAAS